MAQGSLSVALSLKELHALYYAARDAETVFSSALVERYGARAGDMRYRPLPDDLEELAKRAGLASNAYLDAANVRGWGY